MAIDWSSEPRSGGHSFGALGGLGTLAARSLGVTGTCRCERYPPERGVG